jgi:hypothetical protein
MNRGASSDRALTRNPIARSLALAVLGVALVGAAIMGAVVFAALLGLFIVGYLVRLVSQFFWARDAVRIEELQQPAVPNSNLIEAEFEVVDVAADGARRSPGDAA